MFEENCDHSGPENRENQEEEESWGESTLTFCFLPAQIPLPVFHAGVCFDRQEKSAEKDAAEGSAGKNQWDEEDDDDEEEDVKPPDGTADEDDETEEEAEDEFDSGDEEILTKSGESSRGFCVDYWHEEEILILLIVSDVLISR